MLVDDGFGVEKPVDCAVQEFPGYAFAGRSGVSGEYSALPGMETEGGTTTATFPGTYVVEGAAMFATLDRKYPVLLGGAICNPPWLDTGGLGK